MARRVGQIRCIVTFFVRNCLTKKKNGNHKVPVSDELSFSVIRLGLEPKTPTLKVLCSTC